MKKMLISGFVAVILTSAASAAFAQYIYIEPGPGYGPPPGYGYGPPPGPGYGPPPGPGYGPLLLARTIAATMSLETGVAASTIGPADIEPGTDASPDGLCRTVSANPTGDIKIPPR